MCSFVYWITTTYLPTYLPTHPPTHPSPTHLPTYLPTCPPTPALSQLTSIPWHDMGHVCNPALVERKWLRQASAVQKRWDGRQRWGKKGAKDENTWSKVAWRAVSRILATYRSPNDPHWVTSGKTGVETRWRIRPCVLRRRISGVGALLLSRRPCHWCRSLGTKVLRPSSGSNCNCFSPEDGGSTFSVTVVATHRVVVVCGCRRIYWIVERVWMAAEYFVAVQVCKLGVTSFN
jgi:hypothetical protein